MPGVCIKSLGQLEDFCWIRFSSLKVKVSEIKLQRFTKGKKKLSLLGFEPRTLCMAGRNANHYIRTDYTNCNEILSVTISEQIWEA